MVRLVPLPARLPLGGLSSRFRGTRGPRCRSPHRSAADCWPGAAGDATVLPVSSSPSSVSPRARLIAGSHNLRDLGGLVTRSGLTVREGKVFRSDYPAFVEKSPAAASELGLRTVIDLRRGTEVAVECVNWMRHGVAYERWPLIAGARSSWHARYAAYLLHRPESVVGAVRAVMRPAGHAVLFHCAAGKDRTGVVAALLLSVLDVADEDVIADYALSAASVPHVLARLKEIDLYAAMLQGDSVADQEPRAELMRDLLTWLDERGGAEAWLLGQGVPLAELAAFREAMLTGGQ